MGIIAKQSIKGAAALHFYLNSQRYILKTGSTIKKLGNQNGK